jgi:hypothetical protein
MKRSALWLAVLLAGCGGTRRPSGPTFRDSGTIDTGAALDAGSDSGVDGGNNTDSGAADTGTFDSGVPACPVMGPENAIGPCSDACDNDGNGFFDCNDFACCAFRTDCAPGTSCGDQSPECTEIAPENTIARCTNGCDDDPDPNDPPFADCEDRSCCLVREAGGQPCAAGTYCADTFMPRTTLCPGDDVTQEAMREATLGACSNACDDDRNAFDDCNDRNCCAIRIAGNSPCPAGTYCADMWTPGEATLCPGDDVTQPPAPEADTTACSDLCDNDRNGFQDCNDRNCCPFRTDCALGTFCNP